MKSKVQHNAKVATQTAACSFSAVPGPRRDGQIMPYGAPSSLAHAAQLNIRSAAALAGSGVFSCMNSLLIAGEFRYCVSSSVTTARAVLVCLLSVGVSGDS